MSLKFLRILNNKSDLKTKLKEIKKAEVEVNNKVKKYPPEGLNLDDYKDKLTEVGNFGINLWT